MSDNGDAPVREKKSLLRRIFSQAEPAPSKRPAESPDWKPQAKALEEILPVAVPSGEASQLEALSREIPTVAPKRDASGAIEAAEPVDHTGDEAPLPGRPSHVEGDTREEPAAGDMPFVDEAAQPPAEGLTLPVVEEALTIEATPPVGAAEPKRSWWSRLRDGLSRSSSSIGTGIGDIFTKRKLDAAMLEDLEDVLVRADLGVATATRICEAVGQGRYDRDVSPDAVKAILAAEVERVLAPYARPIEIGAAKPFVILVVGVNGSGKTTTIGKLAAKLTSEGRSVTLAAGDTFRAAAIAQLTIWGDRLGCPVVAREQGSDAAGLAFSAMEEAKASGADVLLMDTAGRLQNRAELMAELEKIIRVMRKLDPAAPHAVLLILDATVGQNAMSQVEIFGKVAGVTGLVMTKLDGTARGGILVAIAEKFRLPVHFIGVGETADDLEPFAAKDFAAAIAGLDVATAEPSVV